MKASPRKHLCIWGTFMYIRNFSEAAVAIKKENLKKLKALMQHGKYTVLIYGKICLLEKLLGDNLLKLSFNQQKKMEGSNSKADF